MTARQKPDAEYVAHYSRVVRQILLERGSIPREELEYVVETVSKLKDERLKAGVAGLVGCSKVASNVAATRVSRLRRPISGLAYLEPITSPCSVRRI
jgi:hypothetical protein